MGLVIGTLAFVCAVTYGATYTIGSAARGLGLGLLGGGGLLFVAEIASWVGRVHASGHHVYDQFVALLVIAVVAGVGLLSVYALLRGQRTATAKVRERRVRHPRRPPTSGSRSRTR